MQQYVKLCKHILENGKIKDDRTGTGTISVFGYQSRFDLTKGFPLLTTKKVFHKAAVHELLWFISGSTNIKYLIDNNVKIWNDWPYARYKKSKDFDGETLDEFVTKLKTDAAFLEKWGDLGPVYGKQWRDFNGVDQLNNLIHDIKTNPDSRRLILTMWNPGDLPKMILPPCPTFLQFYVNNGKLSLQLYQRSADIFLGYPFDLTSYALLTHLIAQVCDLEVGEFVYTVGDAHIYLNHIEQIKTQIEREPLELCQLVLNKDIKNIEDFTFEDIKFENYKSHEAIKGAVSV